MKYPKIISPPHRILGNEQSKNNSTESNNRYPQKENHVINPIRASSTFNLKRNKKPAKLKLFRYICICSRKEEKSMNLMIF